MFKKVILGLTICNIALCNLNAMESQSSIKNDDKRHILFSSNNEKQDDTFNIASEPLQYNINSKLLIDDLYKHVSYPINSEHFMILNTVSLDNYIVFRTLLAQILEDETRSSEQKKELLLNMASIYFMMQDEIENQKNNSYMSSYSRISELHVLYNRIQNNIRDQFKSLTGQKNRSDSALDAQIMLDNTVTLPGKPTFKILTDYEQPQTELAQALLASVQKVALKPLDYQIKQNITIKEKNKQNQIVYRHSKVANMSFITALYADMDSLIDSVSFRILNVSLWDNPTLLTDLNNGLLRDIINDTSRDIEDKIKLLEKMAEAYKKLQYSVESNMDGTKDLQFNKSDMSRLGKIYEDAQWSIAAAIEEL